MVALRALLEDLTVGRTIRDKKLFVADNYEELPVTGTKYDTPDMELTGLFCRVTERGCYSWIFRYTNSRGKQKTATIGRCEKMSPSKARVAAKKLLSVDDPAQVKKAKRESLTVNQLLTKYEEEKMGVERGMRDSTRKENIRMLRTKVRDWPIKPKVPMGTMYADEITGTDAANCLVACRKTAKSTSRQVVGLCQRAWAYGISLGVVQSNPWLGQTKPSVKKKSTRMGNEDLPLLGERLKTIKEPIEYKIAVLLYLLTGARHQELCQCRWDWIDFEAQWILVPREYHKSGEKTLEPRQIFLSKQAVELIHAIPHKEVEVDGKKIQHLCLFPAGDQAKDLLSTRDDLQDPWTRIREGQPYEHVNIHDLRRSMTSFLSDLKLKSYAGQILGHSIQGVTEIYTRTAAKPLIEIVQLVSDNIIPKLGWWPR